ncbi:MAG: sensor histidine kinase, partial [Spirochaetales bacterium]
DIEYLRLSRFTSIPGSSFIYDPALAQSFLDYPEVIYVRFDGSAYFKKITQARILSIASAVLMTVVLYYAFSIYNANRRYRIALLKHENLVSLGAAARTLTHEIKNPLSAMTIQMVLLRKMLGKEYEQDLDVMDHEIERLTNLTNRVSEFIKDPVGNPQKLDLVPFLTGISSLFPTPVKLIFNGMEHAVVMFDEVRARSVFENLIKNAIESYSNGEPDVEVELSRAKKKKIEVEIRDRGDGLPKEMTETLFDPFFTTKTKGSGIGLSISRQFVVAAEGKLSLESRNGGGTIARVVLPEVEESL